MSGPVQLTWQNFEANYLDGPPREVILPGSSKLRLFVASDGATFGLRVPLEQTHSVPMSPIAAVSLRETRSAGRRIAELSCLPRSASKEFFYFLLAIVDGIQLKGLAFVDALDAAVAAWRDLLRSLPRMTEEAELGMLGEMLTLRLFIERMGPRAIEHWTGPKRDRHDFRVRQNEFEVKTTRSDSRIHMIHGIGQLLPSQRCRLFVVSWQVERAGGDSGETLPEAIATTRTSLGGDAGARSRFDELLKATTWREEDASMYQERWRPRNAAHAIPVTESFPRITNEVLAAGIAKTTIALISDVQYRVNVEGLGFPVHSKKFAKLVARRKT